ncbi:MAG: hypothetical protein SVV80_08985 [Planctomycetota bacterium]|nr:hypothetical protein [Planctomycetota bacterium]
MQAEFTVEMSDKLIAASVRRYWRRHLGWYGPVMLLFSVFLLVLTLLFGVDTWFGGFLSALGFIGVGFFLSVYFKSRVKPISSWAKVKNRLVQYHVTDERLQIKSSLACSDCKWSAFDRLWRFHDMWLLFCESRFWVFPQTVLTEEIGDFIVRKVLESGDKVL